MLQEVALVGLGCLAGYVLARFYFKGQSLKNYILCLDCKNSPVHVMNEFQAKELKWKWQHFLGLEDFIKDEMKFTAADSTEEKEAKARLERLPVVAAAKAYEVGDSSANIHFLRYLIKRHEEVQIELEKLFDTFAIPIVIDKDYCYSTESLQDSGRVLKQGLNVNTNGIRMTWSENVSYFSGDRVALCRLKMERQLDLDFRDHYQIVSTRVWFDPQDQPLTLKGDKKKM